MVWGFCIMMVVRAVVPFVKTRYGESDLGQQSAEPLRNYGQDTDEFRDAA